MKTRILLSAMLLGTGAILQAATNDLTSSLTKGLFEEDVNHNLPKAIEAYKAVVEQFDHERKLGGTAVFRLGECLRRQGNTNEAVTAYQRVLREFADQRALVTLARQNLISLGVTPLASAEPASADAGRQEQKRLIQEEMKLLEEKLASQNRQMEVGTGDPEAVRATRREILDLKRQMAALDTAPNLSREPASANAGRQEEKRLIQEEIKLLEEKLANQNRRLENGADEHEAIRTTQREIIELKRQIAALDAGRPALERISSHELAGDTTLAEEEEVKRIKGMIKDSPDLINAKSGASTGFTTPLQQAAAKGQLVVAEFLLANGADVDAHDGGTDGRTALHYAAVAGHKAMVELVLDHKADVRAVDNSGMTALHLASEKGFKTLVESLLGHGADINAKTKSGTTPLHLAAVNGFKAIAELLLDRGADVNLITKEVQHGGTPSWSGSVLHIAVALNSPDLAELFLGHQAEANRVDGAGKTPLACAAESGRVAIAKILLAHGAMVDARNTVDNNHRGWTALHYAIDKANKEAAALLLENKADPDARIETPYGGPQAEKGVTGLLMAVRKSSVDMVELLLSYKADPNGKSDAGYLPLSDAMRIALGGPLRARLASLLLNHGAAADAFSPDTEPPLIQASEKDDQETTKLLLDHKANVKVVDSHRNTALHWAVYECDKEITAALLARGAEPNSLNEFGTTPMQLAKTGLSGMIPARAIVGSSGGMPGSKGLNPSIKGADLAIMADIVELLRQHGAVDDVPQLNVIEVRRPSVKYSETVFTKGTNNYNHFTLLELVAAHYGFISSRGSPEKRFSASSFTRQNSLAFPDWEHVTIRRASPDGLSRTSMPENLNVLFKSGDCAGDLTLQWGDVVEIPEADHPIDAAWAGLSQNERSTLEKCLNRQISVTVKGQTTNLLLSPITSRPTKFTMVDDLNWIMARTAEFHVLPALRNSGLLRASSDLSQVKVRRHDSATGQNYELTFDCAHRDSSPDFWLRNGDAIEVPERP